MKSSLLLFRIQIILIIIIVFFNCRDCPASDFDLAQTEKILIEIGNYHFGESLEPMVRLDHIIRDAADTDDLLQIESLIINQMSSKCTFDGKDQLCRRLRFIGTENSTPVLVDMLNDPATFEMALYALEMIPGVKTDDQLYDEFIHRSGWQKLRLINLMGIRSITRAIPELEQRG